MLKLIAILLIYSVCLSPTPEAEKAKRLHCTPIPEFSALYIRATKVIKHYEGYRKLPYQVCGHTCIGYGELKRYVKEDSLSLLQADNVLRKHFDNDVKSVKRLAKTDDYRTILTLAMFTYNCGIGTLKRSKLLKMVNSGATASDIEKVYRSYTFAKGRHLPGLSKRRQSEFLIK